MLIDCSYFTKGSRRILNATMGTVGVMPDPNACEVNSAILGYVGDCQERFLIEMLGPVLGNKIHTYLVCRDEDNSPVYIESLEAVCDKLREPFADYVFFHILRDSDTQPTITGLVRLKSANTNVPPIARQVNAWNDMVEKNRRFAEWAKTDCPLQGVSVSREMTTKINRLNL